MPIKHLMMMSLLVAAAHVMLMSLLMAGGCGGEGSDASIDNSVSDPGDGDGDGDGDVGDGDGDVGDGDGDGDTDASVAEEEPIEIAGTWYNVDLDLVETFSSTAITGDFVPVDIVEYDNDLNMMIVRFEGNEGEPEFIYTKIVWLEPDASGFYYCPVAFELASVEEALAAEDISDSSDPDNGGCDGAPWTRDVPVDEMVAD